VARTSASRPSSSRIESVGAEALARDAAWWRIYEQSFASPSREPVEVILKSLREGVGLAFRACDAAGTTIALATTHLLKQPPAVFLVYLAVDERDRGRGLGRRVLEHAWSASAARVREALGMIWEVDAAPAPGAEPSPEYRRRIAFYERCGAVLLSAGYRQPPVDGSTILPLQLMFRPAHAAARPDAETVHAMIRAMYAEKYLAMNGIPADLLASLEERSRR
jgi:GNAT superfamily N-acetyltransferase